MFAKIVNVVTAAFFILVPIYIFLPGLPAALWRVSVYIVTYPFI